MGDNGTLAQPAARTDSSTLPAVKVQALRAQESSTAPWQGIVAKRSITATKTDTPLIQTPQAVSVITREQMDQQGVTTIDQALRYTPGVYSQDATDFRFDQLRGRGFALDQFLDGLILSPSAFYANPRIDPYFLERIEVLHGPSSVLYGAGSPAGIVDMISKRPSEEAIHELTVQMGNHDRYQFGFDMGGKIDPAGTVSYRVTGLARDADSEVNGIKDQRIAIAPSVTIKPTRDTTFTLYGSYQRDPAGGLFNSLPANGTVGFNANGRIAPSTYLGNPDKDYFRRTQFSLGYEFEQKINEVFTFRQKARYIHDDVDYHQTYFSSYLANSTTTVSENAFLDREHLGQFGLDNQMQAKFSTGPIQHTMLFGLDYQKLIAGTNSGTGSVGTLNVFAPNYSALAGITATTKRVDAASNQVGVYAQDQLQYGRWALTLGARNDWASTNTQTATPTAMTIQHQDVHAFTWRGGLSYLFDSGIAPYAGFTKSFQPTAGVDYAGNALVPTTGEQYEVGVKYQPKGHNAFYTLSAFNLTQQNVTTTDPRHTGYSVQTGEVRSRGIELEAHAALTDELSLIGSYTYLNQVVTRSNTATQLGKRPPISPRHLASLWLDYTLHGGLARGLGFAVGTRVIGPSAGDTANSFDVPGVVLFDAAVHYAIGNWKLAVNGSNLFNRKYASYCQGGSCYYGSTVAVLGTAKYQW